MQCLLGGHLKVIYLLAIFILSVLVLPNVGLAISRVLFGFQVTFQVNTTTFCGSLISVELKFIFPHRYG